MRGLYGRRGLARDHASDSPSCQFRAMTGSKQLHQRVLAGDSKRAYQVFGNNGAETSSRSAQHRDRRPIRQRVLLNNQA